MRLYQVSVFTNSVIRIMNEYTKYKINTQMYIRQCKHHIYLPFVPEVVTVKRGRHWKCLFLSPTNQHRHRKNNVYAHTKDFRYNIQKKIYAFIFNVCVDDVYYMEKSNRVPKHSTSKNRLSNENLRCRRACVLVSL